MTTPRRRDRRRTRIIALLMFAACSPADGDRPPPAESDGAPAAVESAAEGATDEASVTAAEGATDEASVTAAEGATDEAGVTDTDQVAAVEEESGPRTPTPVCFMPEGPLAADASLEDRAGEYRLTMVEEIAGSPSRTVEGSLTLLPQAESLRRFAGSAGASIPGVISTLFGSTDVNVEGVGAVRVGNLSSQDPASPGVLVIESETGGSPSILLRFGSDANRRDIVRFDGGYTVLTVVEITGPSFSGTWASGARGPESEGFFCATPSR